MILQHIATMEELLQICHNLADTWIWLGHWVKLKSTFSCCFLCGHQFIQHCTVWFLQLQVLQRATTKRGSEMLGFYQIQWTTYIDIICIYMYLQFTDVCEYIRYVHMNTLLSYWWTIKQQLRCKIHGSLVTEVKALVATTTFANDTKHRGHQWLWIASWGRTWMCGYICHLGCVSL